MLAGFVALGLVQGALAALGAVGVVVVWRTTRVLNLAQPALGLVGGVLTGLLVSAAGWSFWWAAPIGVATGALMGLAAERLVLVRLQDAPRVVLLVATVGLAHLLTGVQTALPFLFGGRLPSYDVDLGVELFVFPVLLKGAHLLALLVLPIAATAVWWFLHRSRVGVAAVAAGQDAERALTLGVPVRFVRAVAWTISGALSGVAGVLAIPVLGFSLGDGVAPTVLLLAVAPAVIGGLRSIPAAAVTALATGVLYQLVLLAAPHAAMADVGLAVALAVAVALRRGRLGRAEASERASSFAVATSSAPLPRAVLLDPRWRMAKRCAAAALVLAAASPPLWLAASSDVRYATGAALCLGALAVAVAWTFGGAVALGHWGIAAVGATVTALVPGPLLIRAVTAVAVAAAVGCGIALLDRRGGMVGPVTGLAIAVAAPAGMLMVGQVSLGLQAQTAGIVGGVLTAAAAMSAVWLRAQRAGIGLVVARDEPRRAREFGIEPQRARLIVLTASAALAGVSGTLYLAGVPAGLAPGAFVAERSLELFAFAVVGGLGAPLGAPLATAGLLFGEVMLPGVWGTLLAGTGVLLVVLMVPAGLGHALTWLRDLSARLVVGPDALPRREEPSVPAVPEPAGARSSDRPVDIVAGSDTHAAGATPTVRAAMVAAAAVSAPALAVLFGIAPALRSLLALDVGASAPWVVLLLGAAAVAAALAAARRPLDPTRRALPPEVPGLATATLSGLVIMALSDGVLLGLALVAAPVPAGWIVGRLVRYATTGTVAANGSAAAGLVTIAALVGGLGSLQLASVAAGSGLLATLPWAAGYLAAAGLAFQRTAVRVRSDARAARRDRPRRTSRLRAGTLRVTDLRVTYGTSPVLDGVSLDIRPGEVLALVGGNGTGKSTLLRAIAGLTPTETGEVRMSGRDLTILRPEHRAVAGVALVAGARPVLPDLTVRENLRVGGYLTHRSTTAFAAATPHVLAVVPALAEHLDVRAGLLSGGQQRLLALAQTLYRRPAVLLADELTLGLDAQAQHATMSLLRQFADDGVAVVVVDHDLDGLLPASDRAVVLADGQAETLDDVALVEAQRRSGALGAAFLAGAGA